MVIEEGGTIFNELEFSINEDEIREAIRGLKLGKASSQDMILNKMLKAGEPFLRLSLCVMFNKILLSGCCPKSWGRGILTAIHKKGDIHEPSNYIAVILHLVVGGNLGKVFAFCSCFNNRHQIFGLT